MRGKTAEDLGLLELLDPVAEAAGLAIVRLRLSGGDRVRRLQIMAEGEDASLPVADCARLSRAISQVLDAADPISGAYVLEVSSPGVDRPLTRPQDFATYAGLDARLEIDRLEAGRKRFKGKIVGFSGGAVRLLPEDATEAIALPFDWLIEAKLILNDDLLKHGAAQREARLAKTHPEDSTRIRTP